MLVFTLISSYMIGTISFGWDNYTGYAGENYTTTEGILLTLQAYSLMLLPYMAYGMIVVFIAVSAPNMAMTITLGVSIILFAQYLNAFDSIKIFSIVNQIYFFHEYFIKSLEWRNAILSVAVNLSYIATFYLLAVNAIKRKDIVF